MCKTEKNNISMVIKIAATGARMARDFLNAGRIRLRLQKISMMLIINQIECGIAFKEDTVCSELENFHTAPITVCSAKRI
ncbi:hypothetical protein AYB34_04600 [Leptospira sp. ZV016]|nr:hypothetical protein AYB34_04600 [Leptospira sp. ZV016]